MDTITLKEWLAIKDNKVLDGKVLVFTREEFENSFKVLPTR